MTYREYQDYMVKRAGIISENRSRPLRNPPQPRLPVPPKIECPKWRVLYDADGTFEGVLEHDDEPTPEGYKVKLEDRTR